MAIIRQKRKKRFSIIDNQVLEDKRISFKARGLLIYMLSKPDDWKFYPEELAKHSNREGVKAINSALQEMEQVGYLIRRRKRDNRGHFKGIDYLLSEVPQEKSPQSPNRNAGKRNTGLRNSANGTLPNTDFKPNTDGLPNNDFSSGGGGGNPQLNQAYRKEPKEITTPVNENEQIVDDSSATTKKAKIEAILHFKLDDYKLKTISPYLEQLGMNEVNRAIDRTALADRPSFAYLLATVKGMVADNEVRKEAQNGPEIPIYKLGD